MTKIIGLTGGIGSGKSTVASYIASKGVPVYIADDEAKKIMEREDIKQKIQNLFAESILNSDNSLNRKKIAEFVFNNPNKLQELNAIVHPEVQLHFTNWVKSHENYPFIVKEVAILFETGGNKSCDKVILITAPEEVRINRAMSRDNLTKEEILVRISNQYSKFKRRFYTIFMKFIF
uniref:dephospho-CoA kinase n=1 Tax=Flavobacterium sp. TaxID=239 RepID=UPI00404A5988